LCVDRKLREVYLTQEIDDYDKTKEEICQEEEFNKLKEQYVF